MDPCTHGPMDPWTHEPMNATDVLEKVATDVVLFEFGARHSFMATVETAIDREALANWYRRNRERSARLFDIVQPEAYHSRPIALRHPVVFYEGHLPAF